MRSEKARGFVLDFADVEALNNELEPADAMQSLWRYPDTRKRAGGRRRASFALRQVWHSR